MQKPTRRQRKRRSRRAAGAPLDGARAAGMPPSAVAKQNKAGPPRNTPVTPSQTMIMHFFPSKLTSGTPGPGAANEMSPASPQRGKDVENTPRVAGNYEPATPATTADKAGES